METAIECLSKALESNDPISPEKSRDLISIIVAVDTRCAGIYDSINEIFQNTDNRISPYKRTTEGTSTLLVKPIMNLVEDIKKERKIEEQLKTQQISGNVGGKKSPFGDEDPSLQKALLASLSKNKK